MTREVGSSTSSFRVPDDLKARLEEAARISNKGKNRIINEALRQYLDKHETLRREARRQSILASRSRWKDEKRWEKAVVEVWNG